MFMSNILYIFLIFLGEQIKNVFLMTILLLKANEAERLTTAACLLVVFYVGLWYQFGLSVSESTFFIYHILLL